MIRLRKANLLLGLGLGLALFFMTYLVIDTLNIPSNDSELQKIELNALENKLQSLENDLFLNQKAINEIQDTVLGLKKEQVVISADSKAIRSRGQGKVNKTFASIAAGDMTFAQTRPLQCDIRMSDVYDQLPFDNPDGGVWKQGWEIHYDPKTVVDPKNKLKVFVMPHSHCDPGWIKTFERYYQDQVRNILNSMVKKLSEDPKAKFIYAEVSFFSMWWAEQPIGVREKVLGFLKNGQFEIVTGGWVMNDEANSFYYAIIEQLITGHEWLNLNLDGYKPNNGWAIDPFGLSPTMAYINKRTGFDSMLIQRTHYSVKKHLAKEKDLEFMWRQHWDHEDTTDMFTHMMPFYSYDIPHTCGPDPKICCQFDFDRMVGGKSSCPWRIPAKAITQHNVQERATTLLDQYRKKAELYKTNVVLAPLGDDFRYDSPNEWDRQAINYEKLMSHINGNPSFNAEVQFGTLDDYFEAVRAESKEKTGSETGMFKTLSGDFFTYADREDNYWSGYYTSRPFYKNLDRVLEGYLRGAEILYSMMWAEMEFVGKDINEITTPLFAELIQARQNLALFQHHDGVTGTAKDHVVVDYGKKMVDSIGNLQTVITHATLYLLSPRKMNYKVEREEEKFIVDESRDHHFALPKQFTIQIEATEETYKVAVFNSHARTRTEVVTLKVSSPDVRVYKINNIEGDDEEENLACQISPFFNDEQKQISNTEFHLSFSVKIKGFAIETFNIKMMKPEEGRNTDMDVARVVIHNSADHPFQVPPFENVNVFEKGEAFNLQNGYIKANFDANGMLQSVTTLEDKKTNSMKLEFVTYGTKPRGDRSGAYLFMPDGKARVVAIENPYVRIVEGKILSTVEVFLPYCTHKITMKSSPGVDGTGLQIDNFVDIRRMKNVELAMRISSDISSGEEFFTDLNGFQMIKRKRFSKIPLQGNYYPIPSMMYIQDDNSRASIVSRQPLGGSSLSSGQLEIMMDRRLMQDDNRGLFQGVTDNHLTPNTFYLILERKLTSCTDEADDVAASYPSLLAIGVRHSIINPMFKMIWVGPGHSADILTRNYEPIEKDLSCDIHVVSLRTMQATAFKTDPSDETALILHRNGFNGCYKPIGMSCNTNGGRISMEELFPQLYSANMRQMSLSLLYEGLKMEKSFTVSIKPMEMYSFLLKR